MNHSILRSLHQIQWYISVIPAFGRLSQKSGEFNAGLSYKVRPYQKKGKKEEKDFQININNYKAHLGDFRHINTQYWTHLCPGCAGTQDPTFHQQGSISDHKVMSMTLCKHINRLLGSVWTQRKPGNALPKSPGTAVVDKSQCSKGDHRKLNLQNMKGRHHCSSFQPASLVAPLLV